MTVLAAEKMEELRLYMEKEKENQDRLVAAPVVPEAIPIPSSTPVEAVVIDITRDESTRRQRMLAELSLPLTSEEESGDEEDATPEEEEESEGETQVEVLTPPPEEEVPEEEDGGEDELLTPV